MVTINNNKYGYGCGCGCGCGSVGSGSNVNRNNNDYDSGFGCAGCAGDSSANNSDKIAQDAFADYRVSKQASNDIEKAGEAAHAKAAEWFPEKGGMTKTFSASVDSWYTYYYQERQPNGTYLSVPKLIHVKTTSYVSATSVEEEGRVNWYTNDAGSTHGLSS